MSPSVCLRRPNTGWLLLWGERELLKLLWFSWAEMLKLLLGKEAGLLLKLSWVGPLLKLFWVGPLLKAGERWVEWEWKSSGRRSSGRRASKLLRWLPT